jgi:hypothetical protein
MQKPTASSSKYTAKVARPPANPPTTARPGYEDSAEHLDIGVLQYQAAIEAKDIVFSGTDYGVVTQSTSIRMPQQRYNAHLNLYNRFQLLQDNCQDSDSADIDVAVPDREVCHRITSGQISQMSLVRPTNIAREKRKVPTSLIGFV